MTELQALAPAFVSRNAGRAFLGYLDAQRKGLTGERHATRTRELSREHGYDTKYAMHALRIGYQGIELLTTGRITLPMADPQRAALREVRAGRVELAEVLAHLDGVTAQLDHASSAAGLAVYSDVEAVDQFVVDAYRRAWDAGTYAH